MKLSLMIALNVVTSETIKSVRIVDSVGVCVDVSAGASVGFSVEICNSADVDVEPSVEVSDMIALALAVALESALTRFRSR